MFTRSESPLATNPKFNYTVHTKSTGTCILHAVAGLYAVLEPESRPTYERMILDARWDIFSMRKHAMSARRHQIFALPSETYTQVAYLVL